jgi:transcriptional regulator with XRE-family HTH domain
MQQSINERIKILIDTLEKGNQSAFAGKADVSRAVINNIIGGRMNEPSFKVLQKITEAYTNVNTDWLLSGEGSMLGGKSNATQYAQAGRDIGTQAGRDVHHSNNKESDCEQRLAAALRENELLKERIKDKEQMIELLMRR